MKRQLKKGEFLCECCKTNTHKGNGVRKYCKNCSAYLKAKMKTNYYNHKKQLGTTRFERNDLLRVYLYPETKQLVEEVYNTGIIKTPNGKSNYPFVLDFCVKEFVKSKANTFINLEIQSLVSQLLEQDIETKGI